MQTLIVLAYKVLVVVVCRSALPRGLTFGSLWGALRSKPELMEDRRRPGCAAASEDGTSG